MEGTLPNGMTVETDGDLTTLRSGRYTVALSTDGRVLIGFDSQVSEARGVEDWLFAMWQIEEGAQEIGLACFT